MGQVTAQVLGAGDAFGSGGRFQACISIRAAGGHVLLDCGASSLVAMKQRGLDPSSVDAVVVSHLHGDHFGGLPFLVLDGQFSRRVRPLLVAGPPGIAARLPAAMETLFPGSWAVERRFPLRLIELAARDETPLLAGFAVTAYAVAHPSGAPAHALRLAADARVIAYSGDTAWTEALLDVARDADLFLCEAYTLDKPVPHHLSYATLRQHRPRLTCRRLLLTHVGPELLARRAEVDDEIAEDGLMVQC